MVNITVVQFGISFLAIGFVLVGCAKEPIPEETPDISDVGETFDYDPNSMDWELAKTCALYSVLAYDETRIVNMSASLSTQESTQEYIDRNYKNKAGNPYVYYTGERSDRFDFQNEHSPWVLQAQIRYDGYEYIESKNYGDNDEHNISYTFAVVYQII